MSTGPFAVSAERVEGLGARFTGVVNRLLQSEAASASIQGSSLSLNDVESIPDGGVDAVVVDAPETSDWLPQGTSAWQFKRSNLRPSACAEELEAATWAHEFLRDGGSYVLVLGKALSDKLIADRREKLRMRAVELQLISSDDSSSIRVYDANMLARWMSRFPSLAISRLLDGPGQVAISLDEWADSRAHSMEWCPDENRQGLLESLRESLTSAATVEINVQGESGIGKTRLVLEALRGTELEPLVAYVPDASEVNGDLLAYLIRSGSSVVLVVDECPAASHVKLAERLPSDPKIKLVTIGTPGLAATRNPVLRLNALGDSAVGALLESNFPVLWVEARRFVVDHAGGNPRWASIMAQRVLDAPHARVTQLIQRNDLGHFVSELLPEGRDFFLAAGIALFERVGWERELESERGLLAAFLGVSSSELDDVAVRMEQLGLLERKGRYRVAGPHPAAVLMAAAAWEQLSHQILSELLPKLEHGLAIALFRRVADLGEFAPVRETLAPLLGRTGPLASLDALRRSGVAAVLPQIAIALPSETALGLSELIESASIDELRSCSEVRRDLVWALQKLAWHTRTFEAAARCLLRLSVAENESYANNASGVWVDLFGTLLPATAALPIGRLEYLNRLAEVSTAEERLRIVSALERAIETRHESMVVSAELQGGSLVEPRGVPETWTEAWDYQRGALQLLCKLVEDSDPVVSDRACGVIVAAIHPMSVVPALWGDLERRVLSTHRLHQMARTEVAGLMSMLKTTHAFERDPSQETERELKLAAFQSLIGKLPEADSVEALNVALSRHRWEPGGSELQAQLNGAVARFLVDNEELALLELLNSELASGWEFGVALASSALDEPNVLKALGRAYEVNSSVTRGYLTHKLEAGDGGEAIRSFLNGQAGNYLSKPQQLEVAALAPSVPDLQEIAMDIAESLPVAEAAARLRPGVDAHAVIGQLKAWTKRVQTQSDYNVLVQWTAIALRGMEPMPDGTTGALCDLVNKRALFPRTRRASRSWAELAAASLSGNEGAVAEVLLDQVEKGIVHFANESYEAEILGAALRSDTAAVWPELARRLEDGSWRVSTQVRGWILRSIDLEPIFKWVGSDVQRARLVADIAAVGDPDPSPEARFLLGNFPDDREVASSLYASLVTGSWVGNWSDRIQSQMDRLTEWRKDLRYPLGLRKWSGEVVAALAESKRFHLEREAERDI